MGGLSDSQLAVIQTLIDSAPDAAIRSLDMALASEPRADTAMSVIRDLVSTEAGERRARGMVFAPVMALCPRSEPAFAQQTFPQRAISLSWQALKAMHSDRVQQAMAASLTWSDDDRAPEVFDELCGLAAEGLQSPEGTPFEAAAEALESTPGGAADFAGYLALARIAREAQAQMPDWLGRMTGERAASVRLAFKDAEAALDGASPRLFEMLLAGMEEPWLILRVISALMDRPTDTFLAGSEFAGLGERLMDDIDRRLDDLSAFDPYGGPAAGQAAAEAVRAGVTAIIEFEQAIDLKKDGPWGKRITRQKQTLAQKTESLLNKADAAIGEALPLKNAKFGKGTRGVPSFKGPPTPRAVTKAEGMLTFLEQVRPAASAGGYASLRSKTVEKLDERFDSYVEDVLEHLRAPEPESVELAREYLEIAAGLIGRYRDEKAAQIVRRRAAA